MNMAILRGRFKYVRVRLAVLPVVNVATNTTWCMVCFSADGPVTLTLEASDVFISVVAGVHVEPIGTVILFYRFPVRFSTWIWSSLFPYKCS